MLPIVKYNIFYHKPQKRMFAILHRFTHSHYNA